MYCQPQLLRANRRWVRQSLRWLTWMLLAAIIISATLLLVRWRVDGDQLLSVQTGSMVPTFRPGDALLVKPTPWQSLQVGQIVSYRSSFNPKIVVSHRVVSLNRQQRSLVTKGDHLATPDPTVYQSQLVGQAVAVLPTFGRVINTLHSPLGLALVVYVPASGVVIAEIVRLTKHYSAQHYRLYGHH